jgi:signal transduction histidine kinase/CheY-like chemotaxis protein
MEKINIYDIKKLRSYYNETYQLYLNNVSPLIFMNDFLDKIIQLTSSKSGYIMSIFNNNDKKYLIMEALNNNILNSNELVIPKNNMLDLEEDSIVTNVIKTGEYFITNDLKSVDINKGCLSKFDDINTYVSYPIKYLDEVIGIISLVDSEKYDDNTISFLKEVSHLLGILMNNYLSTKNAVNDKRFVSFQLMNEIMNKITDGIIIISEDLNILYYNNLGVQFIKDIRNDDYGDNFYNRNIINLIPQFEFLKTDLTNEKTEHKLFKNKIINLEIEKSENIINYEVLLNSVISNNIINHIFLINAKIDDSNSTNKKTQNNLIAFLSHELRNPLQSLSMAIHLLNKRLKVNDIQDKKLDLYLNTISSSSNEMKRIINDILDLSKIETNEMELILDNHKIEDIIFELIETFTNLAKEKNISLKYIIDPNCPSSIFTDLTRLKQILSNLITNGIKYSNKNSEVIVNAAYNKKAHGINFEIIDFGMGISKEESNNLFKENGKTTNSYKFDVKSNGFGLYLSQKIAHLLEGHISFKSKYNSGSTFTFFHPIKLGMSINMFKSNKLQTKNVSGKILIVDDDESNLAMFRLLLEGFKFEYGIDLDINTVQDGNSAINLCKVQKYDLIFMDINMVGIDGCTATNIIKENYQKNNIKVPVIATTGNIMAKKENQNSNPTENKYICFDNIVIKPYDEENILSILNSYLT